MFNLQTIIKHLVKFQIKPQRNLWGYVANAFNTVDTTRLAEVGPDRLCTEWVIKNGGKIGFVGSGGRLLSNYNALPPTGAKLLVQIVDATDATIMKIGLEHFRNCNHIDTVIFDSCKHLEEDGLEGLLHIKPTLRTLQISRCNNMVDSSFDVLGELKNLKNLRLFDMMYVKDLNSVASKLKTQLPNCEILTK